MVFHRVFSAAVLSVLFLVLVPLRADAQMVTSTANSGAGSLRDTIAAAAPGSVITFDPTLTAGGPVTITLTTGQLNIAKSLTVKGPGAQLLTISGNNASRVFNITTGDFTLSGLTIANAWTNNPFGGGISFIGTGSLTITECRIVNNAVTGSWALGGGLYVRTPAPVRITDTTVSGNTATAAFNGQGGGIFIENPDDGGPANVTIANSTISGNTVTGSGFGLGGGITFSTGGTLLLSNTTVTGNSATATTNAGGGGVFSGGAVTAVNATIAGNTVTGTSGSHFKAFGGIHSARLTLIQTIVAGNTLVSGPAGSAPDVQAVVTSQGFNLIGIADGTTGLVASDLRGTAAAPLDPWLAALADNGGFTQTMALLPGSPAINAGDPAYSLVSASTDQRSFGRVHNGRVDIGAFEYGAFGAVTRPASDGTADGTATLNGIAYRSNLDTDVSFRFGTDPTLAAGTDTAPLRITAGTTAAHVAQDLTGLALDTTYYFKLVLTNAEGRFEGRILSFVLGARISVDQAGTALSDNVGAVDFGRIGTISGNRSKAFTVRNTGEMPLTNLAISMDGADAGDFVVSGFTALTLAPGATTSFIVTFRPSAAGARNATLRVASNTAGEANPFDVALTGTGQMPTIWNGPAITVSNYDFLTPLVRLWRDYEGFYNDNTEGSFNYNDSPAGTLWAFGTTANLSSLRFQTLASILDEYGWVSDLIGRDMVLYLIEENIVLNIRITAWEDWGYTFTYVRSTGVVPDTAAPSINGMPAHIAVEATDANGATVSWVAPWAWDDVDRYLPVSCTPASSSLFAPGTTTVTCRATDAAGNTAERTFTVTVTMTMTNTAPTFTAPANQTLEATSAAGAVATFTATGNDVEDGSLTAACTPASGFMFPMGTTPVTCTVTDSAGQTASGTFTVTVVDTTAPAIVYSGNAGTYQISDTVNITCVATDAVGVTSSTCANISGHATSFQVGANTVTSTASDAAGNTSTASVTFTVVVTSTGLQDLIAQIAGSSAGQLIKALQNVTTAPNANARAGRVTAFKNQVNAQVNSGKITAAQGALLITLIDLMH